jgi:alpha-1,2-mannosyltransferase
VNLRAAISEPLTVGRLRFPPPVLLALALWGSSLLLVVAISRWAVPSDEHAYWLAAQRLLAGLPLYDPSAVPGTPYAYWYPPPLAQVLAPLTPLIPDIAFTAAWTALLLGCLFWLADRRPLVMLALVAFIPVAVELWYRNIHLPLAVLVVLALRRSPLWWIPAAAIKVTPALGVVYLLAARRFRQAAVVGVVGAAVLAISVAFAPAQWEQFLWEVAMRGGSSGASLVPIPFALRFALAIVLAAVGGRQGGRWGEVMLVSALVLGNPTLWATAFSLLIAIVPLWVSAERPRVEPATDRVAGPA